MKFIKIYISGFAILLAAIMLNYIAPKIGLTTWYDFIRSRQIGSFFSVIWLFAIYPFALGFIAWFFNKKFE